ncbi:hypothetical protein BDR22DRAFT_814045 [Usnea florida]
MAHTPWRADIVIGIDFGMTSTGVAYSVDPAWPQPKTIQRWPGRMLNELSNKVPTKIQYDEHTGQVKKWGFQCNPDEEGADIKEFFKLHLDPSYEDQRPNRPSTANARRWLRDYLRCLYGHIRGIFSDSFPKWTAQRTEFVFSVPTTWNNPKMIADLEGIVKDAGFGSDGAEHRSIIGLTEAEAAAVYASQRQFEQGDIILVCDAGGGTTDVNVLRMTSLKGQATRLKQLSYVEGRSIGSALIDIDFEDLLFTRLEKIKQYLLKDPEDVVEEMVRDKFERIKCSFGTPSISTLPRIPFEIPGLAPGHHYPEIAIEDSRMMFTLEELRNLFDKQIDVMLRLIDQQVTRVQEAHPGADISHIVLSGGFGSSPYVKQRFNVHYRPGSYNPSRIGLRNTRVVMVEEPQLAVVQGLVIERWQVTSLGALVFNERCCRLSYGILCREEYDPEHNPSHTGQSVFKSPHDGKIWVEGQIDWFVRQGDTVPIDGILKPYTLKVKPGHDQARWQTHVVICGLPREQLPTNIGQNDVGRLCDINACLKGKNIEVKEKNRHWYNRGERYMRVNFNIRVILGAAEIKFYIESKGDRKEVLSEDHDPIEVIWEP